MNFQIKLTRTNSNDSDFENLVYQLDNDLAIKNGDKNDFFAAFNKIDKINHVVLAYCDGLAVGCGAFKAYENNCVEIKRMFVLNNKRGNGIAGMILSELQLWSKELGYKKCVLETGDKMQEAISLYKKHGCSIIPNYGQYKHIESSVCFEKELD